EMTADAETTTYVPPPLMLVSGEFVCPTRNLLDNPGIYFESETESMEYEVCEAKCKNHDDCNFFWHGTQSSATTCRLFSACDSLVREMGLEGDLMAMPRTPGCVVANPIECFTVSMRRKYLTTA
ncbi:Rs1, partial [Symbiodinium pilosum]